MLELDELLLEVAQLVHDSFTRRLLQQVDVVFDLNDFLAQVNPAEICALYLLKLLVEYAFILKRFLALA